MAREAGRVTYRRGHRARLAAVLCTALLIVVVVAGPALAHATLAASSPADGTVLASAPADVTLTFDEAVRPVAADVQVIDPAGRNVGAAVAGNGAKVTVRLRPATLQGTYTVSWRVISADSHPVAGAITFSVGHPSRPAAVAAARTSMVVSVVFAVARFLAFAGFALLVGVVAFCCYGYPGGIAVRGLRLLIVAGWAALAAGTFSSLVLEGPYGTGAGLGALVRPEVLHQTLGTTYGKALTVRIWMVGALPALLAYGLSRLNAATRTGRAVFGGIGAVTAAAIAATWSVGGHAATGSQPALTVSADIVHLCAMGLWLGGLAAVAITVRARPGVADAAGGVARFSTVAVGSVAVLAVTGLYQAWLRVQTPRALLVTPYGVMLIVKVTLVFTVLCVAFFSRRTLRRREVAGVVPRRLGRLVAVEAAGTVAVVAVTALLVALEPAGTALAAKTATLTARYDTHGSGGAGSVSLRLPGQARGLTHATVVVRDAAGAPRDVPEVDVAWSLPERAIGPISARLTRLGTGRYTAVTTPLAATGRWRIAVTVRTSDIDETTVYLSQTLR
jgi:copper transport protein